MLTLMDAKARKKWAEDLDADRVPAATIENIRQTFRELHGDDLFERGVIESPVPQLGSRPTTRARSGSESSSTW